jgi:N-acetylglucosamine malate deacetylase 2
MGETTSIRQQLDRTIVDRQATLLVVAHPDDDVLGAGALLTRLPDVRIVYVTDGAPRDGFDARAWGFGSWRDYAAARRREAEGALALAGIDPGRAVWLDVADQEATFTLDRIVQSLGVLMVESGARLILTHPYEGGHPDHDAVAFATRAALERVSATPGDRVLAEFTGYHAAPGGGREISFLSRPDHPETEFVLSPAERRLKTAMLARHATQARALAEFPRDREAFRFAPRYDFSRPPHAGRLLYERPSFGAGRGIDGAGWRREVAAAQKRFGVT